MKKKITVAICILCLVPSLVVYAAEYDSYRNNARAAELLQYYYGTPVNNVDDNETVPEAKPKIQWMLWKKSKAEDNVETAEQEVSESADVTESNAGDKGIKPLKQWFIKRKIKEENNLADTAEDVVIEQKTSTDVVEISVEPAPKKEWRFWRKEKTENIVEDNSENIVMEVVVPVTSADENIEIKPKKEKFSFKKDKSEENAVEADTAMDVWTSSEHDNVKSAPVKPGKSKPELSKAENNVEVLYDGGSQEDVSVPDISDVKIKKSNKNKWQLFSKKPAENKNISVTPDVESKVVLPDIQTKSKSEKTPEYTTLTNVQRADIVGEEKELLNVNLTSESPAVAIKDKKEVKKTENAADNVGNTDVSIDSQFLEYYPEKYEIIATGDVVVTLLKDNSKLYADKMVYNTDVSTLKGYGNVKLVKTNQTIDGDFIKINLNEENIFMEKPVTEGTVYKITATEGYVYPGQVVTTEGNFSIKEGAEYLYMTPRMKHLYFEPEAVSKADDENAKKFYEKEEANVQQHPHLKAKTIYIKSLKDHDQVIVKNVSYYFKGKKIFTIPRMDLTTSKYQEYVETTLPEIGSFKEMGSYYGPYGFVVNVPGGAALKVTPVFQLGTDSTKNDYGIGVHGRFHSKNNITEGYIGSVDDKWMVRGQQRITDNLRFQYAHNGYIDEWFLGGRMPENLLQLVHEKRVNVSDLGVHFTNRFTAGYVSDYYNDNLGTGRFRWQTEARKNFYSKWSDDGKVGINVGVIGQTSATLYGTGDFAGMARVGPYVGTRYKNWKQTLVYYQGAQAGESPMLFDRYMYGKSNVTLRETLKINDFVTVGYVGSYALLRDNWEKELVTENSFYVSVGPDDFKIALGYDPIRSRVSLNYLLRLKGDSVDIPYGKMIIDDPENLGKTNKGDKKKKKSEL